MPTYFDTHAHYDDPAFDSDRDAVITAAREAGVGLIMNIACSLASCETTLSLADRYPFVYAALGVHPSDASDITPEGLLHLRSLLTLPKVRAIGEIGLDYHYEGYDKAVQKEAFAAQLELAAETGLPAVIHERDATADTLDILRAFRGRVRGVVHCFSGSVETARELLDMGLYLSFTGVITYRGARRPAEAAAFVPSDRVMIETDSPYLTPVPYRGERNSSLYLPAICSALAAVRGIAPEEAALLTYNNGLAFFGIRGA